MVKALNPLHLQAVVLGWLALSQLAVPCVHIDDY
jgi:hypothetical protein